jgi:hypothetical protein
MAEGIIASTGAHADRTLKSLHSFKDAVLFEVFDGVGIEAISKIGEVS